MLSLLAFGALCVNFSGIIPIFFSSFLGEVGRKGIKPTTSPFFCLNDNSSVKEVATSKGIGYFHQNMTIDASLSKQATEVCTVTFSASDLARMVELIDEKAEISLSVSDIQSLVILNTFSNNHLKFPIGFKSDKAHSPLVDPGEYYVMNHIQMLLCHDEYQNITQVSITPTATGPGESSPFPLSVGLKLSFSFSTNYVPCSNSNSSTLDPSFSVVGFLLIACVSVIITLSIVFCNSYIRNAVLYGYDVLNTQGGEMNQIEVSSSPADHTDSK